MRYLSYQIIFFLFSVSIFAQSPHGDKFDIDCSVCHNADSWKIDLTKITFDHSKTNFPLIGQHQNVDCKSCHQSLVFSKMEKDCFSCHKDIHQGTVGFDCASCHTPTTWIVKDIIALHQKGRFPLLGAHKLADCAQCHAGYAELNFEPLNIDCYACHQQNYILTQNPNHVAANFSTDCQDCHNINALSWRTTNVDHSFFPLVGGHALPSCFSCHQEGGNFSGLSSDCYSCHRQTYEATQNPNHIAAGLQTTCNDCHNINSWAPASFNHDITQFPLTGAHQTVDCAQCHSTGYTGTPTDCYACHQTDYTNTTNPNHQTAGIPTTCAVCHSTTAWQPATFDHNLTEFPLTGAHLTVDCAQCHASGYTGTPTDCYACHQTNYNNTTNPNHQTAGIPTTCAVCHSTTAWQPATFDHNLTEFPLTGAHQTVDCAQCHATGYTGTPTDCYACHQTDYTNTTNPNHQTAGIPTTCAVCHSTTAWQPATFDHNLTEFPLTGAHLTVDCAQCHASGYTGTPTDCYACHQTNYNNTTNPNHQTAGIPTTCAVCHSTTAWQPATFDHNFYPIGNNHNNVNCNECHSQPNYQPQCLSCHLDDFNEGHDTGDPTNCWACHSTSNWDSNFDHNNTNFPLTGAHVGISCQLCHANGYQGTPTECFACHQTDYQQSANPSHTALALSTTCQTCHTTIAGWAPATFPDHNNFYQLLGAHLQINNCADCHQGNYNNTPNTCIGCHQNNYNGTTDPPHQTLNFSDNCLTCHTMNGWTPASFDHNFYPIGNNHNNVNCNECHSQPNYQPQCLSCHLDDFNEGHDTGDPTNCWACHSTSNWDSNFDHNNTNFPLTGAHVGISCQLCHANGYQGTPTECFACHQTDYQQSANPSHTALALSTTCQTCHTTIAGWAPATFPDHNNFYQLLGAHLQINNCADCHQGNYNNTPNTCIGCHQNNYNGTTDPPHQTLNFSDNCLTCHTMNGWTPASFDHNFYPIGNNHNNVNCNECHSEPNYQPQCLSCHLSDFNEGHDTGDPTNCWACHSTSNWDSNFDHNNTNFPLTGAHVGINCQLCHANGYQGTPTDCYACHQTDYQQSANPSHTALALSTTCQTCHTTIAGWAPATFPDHNNFYQLLGAHLQINNCADCHQGNYNNTPNTCIGCHQNNYNGTTDPPHQTLNFSENCLTCHTMTGWIPASFDHNFYPIGSHHNNVNCNECHSQPNYQPQCLSCHLSDFNEGHDTGDPTNCWACHSTSNWDSNFDHNNTNFPLTGAHVGINCQLCHANGYQGTPTDCYACHQTDYQQSANPSHTALALSTTCQTCHTTIAGWAPATFPDHNNFYQLLGAHLQINNCADCHQGNYNNTPNTCIGCHQNNYNGTTDPPHQTLNFSENCLTCHTMTGWIPASFDHNFYPIGSHHNNVNCNECHSQPNYQPQCLSCHLSDFNEGHDTGDPTNCWACHSTSNWDSNFDHNNTNFPLTGAHVGISCQLCHANGYQGTPTECFACHQTDYQQSANPSHTALALSTTCQTCHTTNAGWAPATFPVHNDFYQLLGAHLQINNCADCHQGNYNNTPNTCIGCHQNNYNGTTDPPHQTLNFSENCLTCHTMTGWIPATFNHNFFPIGSHHNNVDCNECHSQPNYQPQCLSCHLNDFNDGHNSGHSTDCWNCHSTSNWDSNLILNFDHNNTYFPLTGAHKKVDCGQCHKGIKEAVLSSECVACHMQDYLNSVNPNHKAMGISTDCVSCHSTNNWDSRLKIIDKNKRLE